MATGSDVLLALVSSVSGGALALFGQTLAHRAASKQHQADLGQRERTLSASFALPVVGRRAECLEEIFELLQLAIDEKKFSMGDYERLRKSLVYVPRDVSDPLLGSLSELFRARRAGDSAGIDAAVTGVRRAQHDVRLSMGLVGVDRYVAELVREDKEGVA